MRVTVKHLAKAADEIADAVKTIAQEIKDTYKSLEDLEKTYIEKAKKENLSYWACSPGYYVVVLS